MFRIKEWGWEILLDLFGTDIKLLCKPSEITVLING